MTLSWHYLIDTIRDNQLKEAQALYKAIDNLRSKYPKSLSMSEVTQYDKKNGTNLKLEINRVRARNIDNQFKFAQSSSEPEKLDNRNLDTDLDIIKAEKSPSVYAPKDANLDFWASLPPFQTLLLSGIGIFFATIVAKIADSCYSKLYGSILSIRKSLTAKNKK